MDRFGAACRVTAVTFLILGLVWGSGASATKEEAKTTGISPDKVAAFVHAVLQAHRTIYTT